MGNLRSVAQALAKVGATPEVTSDAARVAAAERLVVPGQGHFGDCRRALAAGGLDEALLAAIRRGAPFLGVCVGFQLLFDRSAEAPGEPGLGLVPGDVRLLPGGVDEAGLPCKVPHMGWNEVRFDRREGPFATSAERVHLYFAHSYAARAAARDAVAATCTHGVELDAAVLAGNVAGVQFHPEKSQAAGLAIYEAFAGWSP